jgi:pimeloyl-ACP methyl ester carboxylesterase
VILSAQEAGEGPPICVLHGLFGAGTNLRTATRSLQATRRVILLDLRNHGNSPHAPAMSYAEMAADVRETLAALGALPAAFLGHSMGGKAAMRLALDAPEAVTRLLVADIAPVAYQPHFHELVAALRALPLRPGLTRAEASALLAPYVEDAALRAFLLQNLRFGAGAPAWRIGLDAIAANLSLLEGWEAPPGAAYGGPVLFLAGERSGYVRPEYRPAIRALFPAARFATLRDAGHWMHADQPEAFAATATAFLGGR